MTTATDFIALERKAAAISDLIAVEKQRHNDALNKLLKESAAARLAIETASAGLDAEQIAIAEDVIAVHGRLDRPVGESRGRRAKVVSDAIEWLTHCDDADALRARKLPNFHTNYFGIKNYSGFGDQRSDHQYGYGPRHGGIVFKIGLHGKHRNTDLTPEQRNACIYYLRNLERIQNAQVAATEAA